MLGSAAHHRCELKAPVATLMSHMHSQPGSIACNSLQHCNSATDCTRSFAACGIFGCKFVIHYLSAGAAKSAYLHQACQIAAPECLWVLIDMLQAFQGAVLAAVAGEVLLAGVGCLELAQGASCVSAGPA